MARRNNRTSGIGRLVLHVGDHKTGSTSIQVALRRGDVSLNQGRLVYPIVGAHHVNHNNLANSIQREFHGEPRHGDGHPGIYRTRLSALEADVAVLSGESFENVDPAAVRGVIDGEFGGVADEVRAISYVRPHAGRVLSHGAELIKIGWTLTNMRQSLFEVAEEQCTYAHRLRAWKHEFGDDFVVKPFLREQLYQKSVVHDLIKTAVDHQGFEVRPAAAVNASLCVEDLMRVLVVQRHIKGLTRWARHRIGWSLAVWLSDLPEDRSSTKLEIDRELAEHVRSVCLADAKAVDTEFFGGTTFVDALDAAVDNAVDEPMSLRPRDWLEAEEVHQARAFGKMLNSMVLPKGMWTEALRRGWVEKLVYGDDVPEGLEADPFPDEIDLEFT